MITPYAIKLIERRLAHPEWPVVPNYVGNHRAAQWRAAWREAAALSLMTGVLHRVAYSFDQKRDAVRQHNYSPRVRTATRSTIQRNYPPPVK